MPARWHGSSTHARVRGRREPVVTVEAPIAESGGGVAAGADMLSDELGIRAQVPDDFDGRIALGVEQAQQQMVDVEVAGSATVCFLAGALKCALGAWHERQLAGRVAEAALVTKRGSVSAAPGGWPIEDAGPEGG